MIGLGLLVTGTLGGCLGWDALLDEVCPVCPTDGTDDTDATDGTDGTDDTDSTDGTEPEKTLHEKIFVDILGMDDFTGIESSCLLCHYGHARDILETAHWWWQGPVDNIAGLEGELHGKRDLINNL
jgi:hypothetical protein